MSRCLLLCCGYYCYATVTCYASCKLLILYYIPGPDEDGLQQMLVTITPVYHGEPSTSGQSSENKENELLPVKNKEAPIMLLCI